MQSLVKKILVIFQFSNIHNPLMNEGLFNLSYLCFSVGINTGPVIGSPRSNGDRDSLWNVKCYIGVGRNCRVFSVCSLTKLPCYVTAHDTLRRDFDTVCTTTWMSYIAVFTSPENLRLLPRILTNSMYLVWCMPI